MRCQACLDRSDSTPEAHQRVLNSLGKCAPGSSATRSTVAPRPTPRPDQRPAQRLVDRSRRSRPLRKLIETVQHRIGRGLAQAAMTASLHDPTLDLAHFIQIGAGAMPGMHLIDQIAHQSEVPTRQGVQNPQLSWTKKWAKLRIPSRMSRCWRTP
jgi:hypothetical protein